MNTVPIYFFDQDGDSHWHMIPSKHRDRWKLLNGGDPDDEDNNDNINNEFGEYRTGGGIGDIEFAPATDFFEATDKLATALTFLSDAQLAEYQKIIAAKDYSKG